MKLPLFLQGEVATWEIVIWENVHLESAAWEIAHLGSCHLEKYPCKVAAWEKAFGKVPNIKIYTPQVTI